MVIKTCFLWQIKHIFVFKNTGFHSSQLMSCIYETMGSFDIRLNKVASARFTGYYDSNAFHDIATLPENITSSLYWAKRVGKINRILCCDWLAKRAS